MRSNPSEDGSTPVPLSVPELGSIRMPPQGPQLGSDEPHVRQGWPLTLVTSSVLIALVIFLGAGASGVFAHDVIGSKSRAAKYLQRTPKLSESSTSLSSTNRATPDRSQPSSTTSSTATRSTSPMDAASIQAAVTLTPEATTPTSTTTTTTPTVPDTTTIEALGTHLVLNGAVYWFTGVDAYEIGTDWGTNAGCGGEETNAQLDQLFSSLPPNSLVRFWAFQGTMATNENTHQLDWGPIDRVFAAAAAYHQRLIPVLTDQGGTCDGDRWQDPSWYEGGFKNVFTDPPASEGAGYTPISYWTYLQDIVNRYKNSPALGMWEPISEPEASTCQPQYEPFNCGGHETCPNEPTAATALRYFFDAVGGEIHSLDPNHLVESGTIGSGQCGTEGTDYQYVSASPGIDVLSYHDYYGTPAIGGDEWNGLAVRFKQAANLNKPIVGGEVGVMAGAAAGCSSTSGRNAVFQAKSQAQIQAGSSGILAWDWEPTTSGTCSYDIEPSDPLLQHGGAIG